MDRKCSLRLRTSANAGNLFLGAARGFVELMQVIDGWLNVGAESRARVLLPRRCGAGGQGRLAAVRLVRAGQSVVVLSGSTRLVRVGLGLTLRRWDADSLAVKSSAVGLARSSPTQKSRPPTLYTQQPMQRALRTSLPLFRPTGCTCPFLPPLSSRFYAAAAQPKPPPPDKLLTAAHKLLDAAREASEDGSGSIEAAKRMRELDPLRRALGDVLEGEEVSLGKDGGGKVAQRGQELTSPPSCRS